MCDLSVVSGPPLERLMADHEFADRMREFAVDRKHHLKRQEPTLRFPIDVSLGTAFDRVDPTLRDNYIESVVGLAENPECMWKKNRDERDGHQRSGRSRDSCRRT